MAIHWTLGASPEGLYHYETDGNRQVGAQMHDFLT